MTKFHLRSVALVLMVSSMVLGGIAGCSSTPEVKQQRYAKLKSVRDFEYEFPVVWKAIEDAFAKTKVVDRDPKEMNITELKKATERSLETDWIYSLSRDKYQEYKINNFPKKQYLQTRLKYLLKAERIVGGVRVGVELKEELERLKNDGTSAGYDSVSDEELDSSRSSEMLDRIQQSLNAAIP